MLEKLYTRLRVVSYQSSSARSEKWRLDATSQAAMNNPHGSFALSILAMLVLILLVTCVIKRGMPI